MDFSNMRRVCSRAFLESWLQGRMMNETSRSGSHTCLRIFRWSPCPYTCYNMTSQWRTNISPLKRLWQRLYLMQPDIVKIKTMMYLSDWLSKLPFDYQIHPGNQDQSDAHYKFDSRDWERAHSFIFGNQTSKLCLENRHCFKDTAVYTHTLLGLKICNKYKNQPLH